VTALPAWSAAHDSGLAGATDTTKRCIELKPRPSDPLEASSLNANRRQQELAWLAEGNRVDLAVVGGGITGVGVALEAASRGLSVALLERGDLASGTSRFSSKLVHGGLRYLGQGRPGLAWESARERAVLMMIAPHLVRPLPIVVPVTARSPRGMQQMTILLVRIGNLMRAAARTSGQLLPAPRRLTRAEARAFVPGLRAQGLKGALLYWDGQLVDDARLVVAVARTAAAFGARIITYCEVAEIDRAGVRARDRLGGQVVRISARRVINAAGVWADQLVGGVALRPSKGSHLIVPAQALGSPRAALFAPERFGRFVFALPNLEEQILIGVTDEAISDERPHEPEVSSAEEEHLLEVISEPLAAPLSADDVIGRFAGLRPLLAGRGDSTSDLSRKHSVLEDEATGAVTVVGGKLTTYRAMAEDVLRVVAQDPGFRLSASRTRHLPLVGAAARDELDQLDAPARLIQRYGAEAPALVRRAAAEGRALNLTAKVVPGADTLEIEFVHGIEHEGALSASDLIDRRTRLGSIAALRPLALVAAERALTQARVAEIAQTRRRSDAADVPRDS